MSAINSALEENPPVAKAALLKTAAALLSPTAVLHWVTGITLFAGFVHVRSLDIELAARH